MVQKIHILHKRHCGDFTGHSGKEAACLLGIVSDHHQSIVELREDGFNPFAESFISPCWWSPVLLIQSIKHFKDDIFSSKRFF